MRIGQWEVRDNIDPRYNVIYFGDNIDFRIIPKNCSTTAKVLWCELYDKTIKDKTAEGNPHGLIPDGEITLGPRKAAIKKEGRLFRKSSIRVAVKRDPIDRWISAINFSILMAEYGKYPRFNDFTWVSWNINQIASYQYGFGFMINELLPQSYCAGGIDKYTHVYTMETFEDFFLLLEEQLDRKFTRVEATKTKGKGRWTREDLNDDSIKMLTEMYAKDYELGWTI